MRAQLIALIQVLKAEWSVIEVTKSFNKVNIKDRELCDRLDIILSSMQKGINDAISAAELAIRRYDEVYPPITYPNGGIEPSAYCNNSN